MNLKDNKVAELCEQLAHIRRRKDRLSQMLDELNKREKGVAFDLNGALGIIPVKEAAERVKWIMNKSKELSAKHHSESMKRLWESKTAEERAIWKNKLGRKRITITTLEIVDSKKDCM